MGRRRQNHQEGLKESHLTVCHLYNRSTKCCWPCHLSVFTPRKAVSKLSVSSDARRRKGFKPSVWARQSVAHQLVNGKCMTYRNRCLWNVISYDPCMRRMACWWSLPGREEREQLAGGGCVVVQTPQNNSRRLQSKYFSVRRRLPTCSRLPRRADSISLFHS